MAHPIALHSVKQVGPSTPMVAEVEIGLAFPDEIPDVLQIYSDVVLGQPIYAGNTDKHKADLAIKLKLLPGRIYNLTLYPRMFDSPGVLSERVDGDYWEHAAVRLPSFSTAPPPTEVTPTTHPGAPIITRVEAFPPTIHGQGHIETFFVVSYPPGQAPTHFNIRINHQEQVEVEADQSSYRWDTLPGQSFSFAIQACIRKTFVFQFENSHCSDWTVARVAAAPTLTSLRRFLDGVDASHGIRAILRRERVSSVLRLMNKHKYF